MFPNLARWVEGVKENGGDLASPRASAETRGCTGLTMMLANVGSSSWVRKSSPRSEERRGGGGTVTQGKSSKQKTKGLSEDESMWRKGASRILIAQSENKGLKGQKGPEEGNPTENDQESFMKNTEGGSLI